MPPLSVALVLSSLAFEPPAEDPISADPLAEDEPEASEDEPEASEGDEGDEGGGEGDELEALGPASSYSLLGRFRVHVDGTVFGFSHYKEWFEDDVDPMEVEDVQNRVGLGVGQQNFGVGLGYGITDGLVVGAKLGLGFNHVQLVNDDPIDAPDQIGRSLTWMFRPYVEYAFIPGGRFRPFVFVHGGVGGTRTLGTDTGDMAGKVINHTLLGTIGGGGGLHAFIVPQVSVDVFLEVDHYFAQDRTRILDENGDPPPMSLEPEYLRAYQQTDVGALVGLSLWLP
jgi:hypothetical protein